ARRVGNKCCSRIGRTQQRLNLKKSNRGVFGEVQNLKGRVGGGAGVEAGRMGRRVGSAERINQIPGMQSPDPCPVEGVPMKMAALRAVHENDPYLMASSKLRSTGSFGVSMRSRGFSPPS